MKYILILNLLLLHSCSSAVLINKKDCSPINNPEIEFCLKSSRP